MRGQGRTCADAPGCAGNEKTFTASLCSREAVLSLTPAQKRDAQEIFRAGTACADCGGIHHRACPRVMEKEFHPNGNLVRVRYFARYDDTGVIWPEDAFDPDEEDAGER